MRSPPNRLTLIDWRRRAAALYAEVRQAPTGEHASACARFRAGRDQLFRSHPDSPLAEEVRTRLRGLAYYRYDPGWRLSASLEATAGRDGMTVELGTDGAVRYTPVAVARFTSPYGPASLNVYWIEGYGGGLFLPFRDRSNGGETFGGGRYLYDTLKGADLGGSERSLVLDFNYGYNPSCAYDGRWVCPLAPEKNALPFAVPAGERRFR